MKRLFNREKQPKLAKPVSGTKDIAATPAVLSALPEVRDLFGMRFCIH